MGQSTGKGAKSNLVPKLLIDFCNLKEFKLGSLLKLYEEHKIGRFSDNEEEDGPFTLVCKTRLDEGRCYFLIENDIAMGLHELDPGSFILPSEPQFVSLWENLRSSQDYYQTALDRCIKEGRVEISFAEDVLEVFRRVQITAVGDNENKWQPRIIFDPNLYEMRQITPSVPRVYPSELETYIDFEIANVIYKERGDEVFPYIKKCNNCKKYYVAKTLRSEQKYCSSKCKREKTWPREKRNIYMRGYRQKQKKQKNEERQLELEMEINRRMKVAKMTRDEVIEQMKEDGDL